ncbi:MAG: dTDP-glucose 4,6-dehydratase [Mesorhizobium sp.]
MRILVTGGAGFIGSNLCRRLVLEAGHDVVNVDKLTYASNPASLRDIEGHPRYHFVKADICDEGAMHAAMRRHDVDAVMHLAAESHVDRSIESPDDFVRTNVVGTVRLLAAARRHFESLDGARRAAFRFHHVSTDEVFGDLPFDTGVFTEETPYNPNSPYAASKAASDHFVRAWHATYGLPVVLSNCSNNYGPFQHPEKLVPLTIIQACRGQDLPVYGAGRNVRDWLHVADHVRALELVLERGRAGATYLIGGRSERRNIDVVKTICAMLDETRPRGQGRSHAERIRFVADRPGHDRRYAIDPSRIETDLGWRARESFDDGMRETVTWYLENEWWWRSFPEVGMATDA